MEMWFSSFDEHWYSVEMFFQAVVCCISFCSVERLQTGFDINSVFQPFGVGKLSIICCFIDAVLVMMFVI